MSESRPHATRFLREGADQTKPREFAERCVSPAVVLLVLDVHDGDDNSSCNLLRTTPCVTHPTHPPITPDVCCRPTRHFQLADAEPARRQRREYISQSHVHTLVKDRHEVLTWF